MKILQLYKYLFYRLYSWNLKKWGPGVGPEYNALLGVTFMMGANILFFAILLQMTGIMEIFVKPTPNLKIVIFGTIVCTINYFWFIYKRKYYKIIKSYENETQENRLRNLIYLWIYFVLSMGINVILVIIIGENR
jgi:divalent metal cation (Fe/Co/Zn/Cd) transporter